MKQCPNLPVGCQAAITENSVHTLHSNRRTYAKHELDNYHKHGCTCSSMDGRRADSCMGSRNASSVPTFEIISAPGTLVTIAHTSSNLFTTPCEAIMTRYDQQLFISLFKQIVMSYMKGNRKSTPRKHESRGTGLPLKHKPAEAGEH